VVGDPLDEATDVSALITAGERDRVKSWIDEAVDGGAHVTAGGVVRDDGMLAPTVLTNVTPEMKVCSQEVFGPVVAVQTYQELDDALRLANDTRYGLQAAIFTQDLAVADAVGGLFVACDVASSAAVNAAFARCAQELGRLDIAHLNAGVATDVTDIAQLSDDEYRRMMGVNVDGVVFGARAAARIMRE